MFKFLPPVPSVATMSGTSSALAQAPMSALMHLFGTPMLPLMNVPTSLLTVATSGIANGGNNPNQAQAI